MNHVFMARRDFNGNDVARELGGKGHFAGCANGAIFSHENRAAARHPFQHAKQPSAAPKLRVRRHLNESDLRDEFSRWG